MGSRPTFKEGIMTKYPLTWPTGWQRRADGADQSRLE